MRKRVSASHKRLWLGSVVGALVGSIGQYLSGGNITDTRAVALSLVATVAWGAIASSSGAAVNKRLTQP